MTKSKGYSLAISFSISLLLHAVILGVGIWYVVRHVAPLISIKPGSGGDGIAAGQIYLPSTPWAKIDEQMIPAPPPMMLDIVTAVPSEDVKFVEPQSAMGSEDGSVDPMDGGDTARFGVPSASQAPSFVTRFRPGYFQTQEQQGDSHTGPPGQGGEGGDGFATGPPAPSSRNRAPRYPVEARRKGIEGTVTLQLNVRADGSVGDVQVNDSSGSRLLDDAAVEAARDWLFVPSVAGARMSETRVTLPVRFVLHQ
jgi:protein TonB